MDNFKPETTKFQIEGTAPLIVDNLVNRRQHNSPKDYVHSLYAFRDGKRTGLPSVALKAAMVRAAKNLGYTMSSIRGMFHVGFDEDNLIEIKGGHREQESKWETKKGEKAIYYGKYPQWKMQVPVIFNATELTKEKIREMLKEAGKNLGIGQWRPEKMPKDKTDCFGTFEVK